MSRFSLIVAQNVQNARLLAVTVGFLLALVGGGVALAADPSFP
jgi:hypothetical protein